MPKFFVPDYDGDFSCKCGACRRSCCAGWNISMSMREYIALRSLKGSADLQNRIEGGLKIIGDDRERYAAFVRGENGACPLLCADGLCALQRECGEEPLPSVCRMYPRAISGREIALSASCEKVAELLLGSAQPLTFTEIETDQYSAPHGEPTGERVARFAGEMRKVVLRVLQDRTMHIADRIAGLLALMYELHEFEKQGDAQGLCAAADELSGRKFSPFKPPEADWMHLSLPLMIAGAFIPQSPSLGNFWPKITAALRLSEDRAQWTEESFVLAERRYAICKSRFCDTHPHWQEQWERLMTNYAFYTHFPLSDRLAGLREEALAFAACYALTRFVCVTCIAENPDPDALVDTVAAVMRLVEHSGFDLRCARMLRGSRFDRSALLRDMLLTV